MYAFYDHCIITISVILFTLYCVIAQRRFKFHILQTGGCHIYCCMDIYTLERNLPCAFVKRESDNGIRLMLRHVRHANLILRTNLFD